MKIGTVVNIRVSPTNCMAISDAIKLAGLNPEDMTFSSAVSRVLDMMMDSLRRDHLIPTRDGFELSDMMGEFIQKNKASLPSVSYRQPTIREDAQTPTVASKTTTHEQRLANVRFKELMVKREHAPDSWTEDDARELELVQDQML